MPEKSSARVFARGAEAAGLLRALHGWRSVPARPSGNRGLTTFRPEPPGGARDCTAPAVALEGRRLSGGPPLFAKGRSPLARPGRSGHHDRAAIDATARN